MKALYQAGVLMFRSSKNMSKTISYKKKFVSRTHADNKKKLALGSRDGIRRVSMRDLIARMSSIQKYMIPM